MNMGCPLNVLAATLTCVVMTSATAQEAPHIGVPNGNWCMLTLPDAPPDTMRVDLRGFGLPGTLSLYRHSNRSDTFQVFAVDGAGQWRAVDPGPVLTYRGTVDGHAGQVAASLSNTTPRTLSAIVWLDDGTGWNIQPASGIDRGALRTDHFVARIQDLPPTEGVCGVDDRIRPAIAGHVPPPANGPVDWRLAELIYDADVEYYQANGSSVASTMADIEGIQNAVNVIYERDTAITHPINAIIVRTAEPDPYSSSGPNELLGQVQAAWQSSPMSRDLVHLMTGRDLNGSTVGIARLPGVCSMINGYGLSQTMYTTLFAHRTALTAHELGHNWNADHCNQFSPPQMPCNIMCSSIGGCNGVGAPEFGPFSAGVIRNHAASATCLSNPADQVWVEFGYSGPQNGWFHRPYATLAQAVAAAPFGASIRIKAGSSSESNTISKPLQLHSWGGAATIGN